MMKRTLDFFAHDDKYFPDPNDWNAEDSDSDSEAEDDTRTVKPPNAKKRKQQQDVVFNTTKAQGRRRYRGKKLTKRLKNKKRQVPRVNNRVYKASPWPDLEGDAKTIHDVIPKKDKKGVTNRSYGATTVVCCVLLIRGSYRKLCFSNSKGAMPVRLRNKAHALGYHVVQAMQSHAEGELIQYAKTYKDVTLVDMGCDKEHCKECNFLLNVYSNGGFDTQTETSDKTFKNYYMPEPLQDAVGMDDRPKEEFPSFF